MKKLSKKETKELLKILDSKTVSITVTLCNGAQITISKKVFDQMYSDNKIN